MIDLATELLGASRSATRAAASLPQWWASVGQPIAFTILGQPVSKANSRRIVTLARGKPNERTAVIKSTDAIAYERDALLQIPQQFRLRLAGPVFVTMTLWYASERSDLDESIVLDVMADRYAKDRGNTRVLVQAGVYRNDRQVREKWIKHGIDVRNPRAEIAVQPMVAQQAPLF